MTARTLTARTLTARTLTAGTLAAAGAGAAGSPALDVLRDLEVPYLGLLERTVARDIVTMNVFGEHRDSLDRLKEQHGASAIGAVGIDSFRIHIRDVAARRTAAGSDTVNEAGIVRVEIVEASGELAGDQRDIHHERFAVVGPAMAGIRNTPLDGSGEFAQVWFSGNDTDGSAERILSEERSLRTTQHLNALDVHQSRINLLAYGRDGNLVVVLPDGSVLNGDQRTEVTDAAQGHVEAVRSAATAIHHEARNGAEVVLECLGVQGIELLIGDRGHRLR